MIRSIRKLSRLLFWICSRVLKRRRQGRHDSDVHVKLDAVAIHRYILTLHHNALHHGERLILNTSIRSVISAHNMDHGRYHKMAYRDCFFSFARSSRNATLLDHHYFQSDHHYRVPIGYHPMFTPPDSVDLTETEGGSIEFLGSTHPNYGQFDAQFWNMPTRLDTLSRLRASHPELGRRTPDMGEYRDILIKSEFFLCLPGVSMPLCHNLYESIACACIPLLHVNYAKWLDTELQSLLKSVTYQSDEELLDWIPKIKAGDFISRPNELALALMTHCSKALSWPSIKSSIIKSEKALICAEEVSVKLAIEA